MRRAFIDERDWCGNGEFNCILDTKRTQRRAQESLCELTAYLGDRLGLQIDHVEMRRAVRQIENITLVGRFVLSPRLDGVAGDRFIPRVDMNEMFSFNRAGIAPRVLAWITTHARGDAHAIKRHTFGHVTFRRYAHGVRAVHVSPRSLPRGWSRLPFRLPRWRSQRRSLVLTASLIEPLVPKAHR